MCLTLRNATAVLDHLDGRFPSPGYTRTQHHIGHLDPVIGGSPHRKRRRTSRPAVHRRHDRIVVTDQYGSSYSHPCNAVVPTAVLDARVRMV